MIKHVRKLHIAQHFQRLVVHSFIVVQICQVVIIGIFPTRSEQFVLIILQKLFRPFKFLQITAERGDVFVIPFRDQAVGQQQICF